MDSVSKDRDHSANQAPSIPSHVSYCKDKFILGSGREMEPDSERIQNQTKMIFREAVKGLVSSPQ